MSTTWLVNRTQWKKRLVVGVSFFLLGILYLKVIAPTFQLHIPCIFNKLTGLYCPGCGITRAALALLDIQLYQSFRYNMLAYLLTPIYLVYSILLVKRQIIYSTRVMLLMLVLAIGFGILRNIPMFNWLAPTTVK